MTPTEGTQPKVTRRTPTSANGLPPHLPWRLRHPRTLSRRRRSRLLRKAAPAPPVHLQWRLRHPRKLRSRSRRRLLGKQHLLFFWFRVGAIKARRARLPRRVWRFQRLGLRRERWSEVYSRTPPSNNNQKVYIHGFYKYLNHGAGGEHSRRMATQHTQHVHKIVDKLEKNGPDLLALLRNMGYVKGYKLREAPAAQCDVICKACSISSSLCRNGCLCHPTASQSTW